MGAAPVTPEKQRHLHWHDKEPQEQTTKRLDIPMPGAQIQMHNTGSRVHFYLFKLHRIGGVVAGLFLLLLGISGSVMAFSGEIDCALHPSLFKVVPKGQLLSLSQLASSAASVLHAG